LSILISYNLSARDHYIITNRVENPRYSKPNRERYSIWRAVDLLVQVGLTGEYEHSPIVTADNTLTLLKKETGIG